MSRVGELALIWLLTRAEGKGARSELARALKPFADHRWSSGEWGGRLEETLARLCQHQLVTQNARKGLALTAQGRARALQVLGVERLPKGTTWKQLKSVHLVVLALGMAPSAANLSRLARAEGMCAALVQKHLGLEPSSPRSLLQVRDMLCWHQLGVQTDQPFTLAAVQALLLTRSLQATREVAAPQALRQLAARSVGARRTDTESLRLAALRAWTFPAEEPAPAMVAPGSHEEALRTFAEHVVRAARSATAGRFGDDRVFISHVWRAMRSQGLDEQAFKRRLLEANQRRLLSLSRADMVELMDPAELAASEIQHLGATFHFIAL